MENNVDPDIVKLLLENDAVPFSKDTTHESALVIASKMSSRMLPLIVKYIKDEQVLNVPDVEGNRICIPIHTVDIWKMMKFFVDDSIQSTRATTNPFVLFLNARSIMKLLSHLLGLVFQASRRCIIARKIII